MTPPEMSSGSACGGRRQREEDENRLLLFGWCSSLFTVSPPAWWEDLEHFLCWIFLPRNTSWTYTFLVKPEPFIEQIRVNNIHTSVPWITPNAKLSQGIYESIIASTVTTPLTCSFTPQHCQSNKEGMRNLQLYVYCKNTLTDSCYSATWVRRLLWECDL